MSFFTKWEKIIKETPFARNPMYEKLIKKDAKIGTTLKIKYPTKENKMTNENTKPEPKDSEISNRERHEQNCRLSCLAHAVDVARITQDHDNIINRAKLYYDFVKEGK